LRLINFSLAIIFLISKKFTNLFYKAYLLLEFSLVDSSPLSPSAEFVFEVAEVDPLSELGDASVDCDFPDSEVTSLAADEEAFDVELPEDPAEELPLLTGAETAGDDELELGDPKTAAEGAA
jgi:hypothetical protein